MYGSDFDEPCEADLTEIKLIIEANKGRLLED